MRATLTSGCNQSVNPEVASTTQFNGLSCNWRQFTARWFHLFKATLRDLVVGWLFLTRESRCKTGASVFRSIASHPNCIGPNKRPYHTIIPAFIEQPGGELNVAFGVMGGHMQPQGHLQVVCRMMFAGQNPQAALDAPALAIGSAVTKLPLNKVGMQICTMHYFGIMGHELGNRRITLSEVWWWSSRVSGRSGVCRRK